MWRYLLILQICALSLARPVDADEPTTDGWARIPAGSFPMGAPVGQPRRSLDEGPVHDVHLTRALFVKKTEVTQAEWKGLMGTAPARFSACGGDCPVEQVNWWEALAYCNALSARHGLPQCYVLGGCDGRQPGQDMECRSVRFEGLECRGYRLPTEAEWEYMARAGEPPLVRCPPSNEPWSADWRPLEAVAWHGENSMVTYAGGACDSEGDGDETPSCGPHPVATRAPNAWGLFDLRGNVWEWCWDWYGAYASAALTDPLGPSSGSFRVFRGGSWRLEPRHARAGSRSGFVAGFRSDTVGFRPVRTAPETE